MTSARDILDSAMSEDELLDAVVETALRHGWLVAHIPDRLYSLAAKEGRVDALAGAKGLPDLILVGPDHELGTGTTVIFAELKSMSRQVTAEQREWLDALNGAATVRTRVWRPSDRDEIDFTLTGQVEDD